MALDDEYEFDELETIDEEGEADDLETLPDEDAFEPASELEARPAPEPASAFVRAENEDDDGYDPYSDRPAPREPLFERDPWG